MENIFVMSKKKITLINILIINYIYVEKREIKNGICFRFYKILKEKSFADKEEAELFLDWIHKFDNSIQCSDTWFDVSAKGIAEYWQCEGNSLLNWKTHGYKTLFDLLLVCETCNNVYYKMCAYYIFTFLISIFFILLFLLSEQNPRLQGNINVNRKN